ncbi:protein phosphatase CheZ [Skermanella sp. TT6]|uniref:Protein phosphatase CheZ n=1 Tax=Skermanella cutis TaxID=2775420 RepID=A0ABX7B396_9PROT|nr:protein phosphatase CheZ [Skermanella sp. TT6]QQP88814.1 protein phosphatase CheZ [Skermanella sp. TT6]
MTTAPFGSTPPLHQRLALARDEIRQPFAREEVAGIVTAVLTSMEGDVSAADLKLYGELEALARYIQHAKREIAAIRPDDIGSEHIASATDELDAVVGATEDATNRIMDSCDVIGAIAGKVDPENGAALTAAVTAIFEACNFQDITGQRITKVVRTLKHIEGRIDVLIQALGDEVQKTHRDAAAAADPGDESSLLNGPQLPGNAIDQSEIDKLLASFD